MTILRSLPLALFLCLTAARAQTSVYGTVAFTNFGTDAAYVSSSSNSGGFMGGAFYNFPIASRLTAGIDGRILYSPAATGGTFGGVALRIGFVPHKNPLRPYFQLGGGVVSVSAPTLSFVSTGLSNVAINGSQRYTNGAAEIAFGLDIRLNDSFDIRAFDYGAAAGAANRSYAAFLDAGVVYHLRPRRP